jgi:hypothetical protein
MSRCGTLAKKSVTNSLHFSSDDEPSRDPHFRLLLVLSLTDYRINFRFHVRLIILPKR